MRQNESQKAPTMGVIKAHLCVAGSILPAGNANQCVLTRVVVTNRKHALQTLPSGCNKQVCSSAESSGIKSRGDDTKMMMMVESSRSKDD
jgi:hypothetical protein